MKQSEERVIRELAQDENFHKRQAKGLRVHIQDIVTMARNECYAIRTGQARGPRMRDCIGQWESTIRALQSFLDATKEG